MMTPPLHLSHHAQIRRVQHTSPACVLALLRSGSGTDFLTECQGWKAPQHEARDQCPGK
jgi:hypothetical protein